MLVRGLSLAALALGLSFLPLGAQPGKELVKDYIKKDTRAETVKATLAAFGLPTLDGPWSFAGPFPLPDQNAFSKAYPPEKNVDLKATYTVEGVKGEITWQSMPKLELGKIVDLSRLFLKHRNNQNVYLYHEFTSPEEFSLPLSLGSDDAIAVFFNGKNLFSSSVVRPAKADQDSVMLDVKVGTNKLLLKVGQYSGQWAVYVSPDLPKLVGGSVIKRLERDFPPASETKTIASSASIESASYALTTLPIPEEANLEVGGLGFRPDGKLLVCTRRGDVWLVHNPTVEDLSQLKITRFATGLHEALGMHVVDDRTVYVIHRPELTKLVDRDGDGTADEFTTVSDRWGVSGNYHEYAFGPARNRSGHFFLNLNVAFGDGHQARSPWRGWCLKIDPSTGAMEPWAYGLRSPNGINFSPHGDLFYCDNQGEWCATNKLCHLQQGKFYGHQASLRWVKDSAFAKDAPTDDKLPSGMLYDGQKGPTANSPEGMPPVVPPAVWFPYGRMGNSASEPIWDTTGGKFGPYTGQIFVGDQTKASVMRVALEKVNGVFQGACFPFRAGLQCGVNRLAFAPDGSLLVGETNRGWGSIGGKPWGLQRIAYTGTLPFEIHHIALTKDGFDLTFTKPLDANSIEKLTNISIGSFTYIYHSTYGSPEVDKRAENVTSAKLSADGRTLSVAGPVLKKGRVYEFRLEGVKAKDGSNVLHPEAYYTLNELAK